MKKKIDFKQPKYILPLIALLPLTFLLYNVSSLFAGSNKETAHVVKDSINTELPEADGQEMEGKLAAMDKVDWSDEAYTGVERLGEEEQKTEETSQGYSEDELNEIDRRNAKRKHDEQEQAALERSLAEAKKHVNNYEGAYPTSGGRASRSGHRGGNTRSQYDELEDYASALEEIQQRNSRRAMGGYQGGTNEYSGGHAASHEVSSAAQEVVAKHEEKPALVYKTPEKDVEKFHTINNAPVGESSLIKAIIDRTTKARTGTRLRFKLLDGVTIKGVHLPKGTYLYGIVSGFENQRVKATITSILIKDKFVKVNLSVYDNDGMEGFYVPTSLFRNFVKEASAQAVQGNMNFNSNQGTAISAEAMALQALQNVYSSATTAISSNLKEEKARIKYNTTVYLINASSDNE